MITDKSDQARGDGPGTYLDGLPIGRRPQLRADGVPSWDIFPFEGELRVKVLDEPVLPEPPRQGEAGAEECDQCARPDSDFLWTDEHWRLSGSARPAGPPAVVLLQPPPAFGREVPPIAHHDLTDLPPARAAELGAMLQRTERAVLSLGGIARVHLNKWGDGAAHLRLWLIARPAGMAQLRGACLPLWNDALPPVPAEAWARTGRLIAAAMAAGGGTAQL
ncbi:hypothetical protein [Kitasatospora herbaricolor]|uniref:Diadenosine tetraphosphate (Ap4A) HIT family hydrolase n=1 Tax=Kitasatospora herbaricolor TaxID=68217 RepID=A0ABZ1W387_9ACTN|nr:hypothetical protein [Kitasatospora herbaricolor]